MLFDTDATMVVPERWAAIPVQGCDMERLNLPFYYQLGASLNPLVQTDLTKATKGQVYFAAFQARLPLTVLLNSVQSLKVCRASGDGLLAAIDELDLWFKQAGVPAQFDDPIKPTDVAFQNVPIIAAHFAAVLSAELASLVTYHVTQKGIYDTNDLVERADRCLPDQVRTVIGEVATYEIQQGGRCLALDCPTACGFHMLRALEAVLHKYYLSVCGLPEQKPLDNWGAYLLALRKAAGLDDPRQKSPSKPTITDPAVLKHVTRVVALIQQLKDQNRNLIMHPEIVLTVEEASGLFETVKAAIIEMAT